MWWVTLVNLRYCYFLVYIETSIANTSLDLIKTASKGSNRLYITYILPVY